MARISKQELIRLQKKLLSDAAIGAEFGITRQAVHQLRNKYGIPVVTGKLDKRDAKIAALRKKGVKGMAIAKKLDLSLAVVYRVFGQANKAKAKKVKGQG